MCVLWGDTKTLPQVCTIVSWLLLPSLPGLATVQMCPFELRESHWGWTERLPFPGAPTWSCMVSLVGLCTPAWALKDRGQGSREIQIHWVAPHPGRRAFTPQAVWGLRAVERGQVPTEGLSPEPPPGAAHPSLYPSPKTASQEVAERQALSHSFPGFWATSVAGEGGKAVCSGPSSASWNSRSQHFI